MPNLTCTRSHSKKKSQKGAQQEQVPGQVDSAQREAAESPESHVAVALVARVHKAGSKHKALVLSTDFSRSRTGNIG